MAAHSFNTGPLATDQYSRSMVDLYDEREHIGVPTGFQSWFGRQASGGRTLFSPDSSLVEIDILRGNEKIAALIPRGMISRPLGKLQKNTAAEKFSTFSRRYPLAEEEGGIEAGQLEFRAAGENPYVSRTRLDRMRSLARQNHLEHIRRMLRMFEVLCTQSILEGYQDAILGAFASGTSDKYYDFVRKSSHSFSVGTPWSNIAADILGDIDGACALLRIDGHVTADVCIMGETAVGGFLKNTDVKDKADNRRFELIEVNQNMPVPPSHQFLIDGGFIPRGRLRTPNGYTVWVFTYQDVYTDDSGNAVPYMPVDKVLIGSTMARCDRYFGPPEILPNIPMRQQFYQQLFGFDSESPPMPPMIKNQGAVVNPGMFYSDAYASADWKSVTIRTQAAPIFATTMTDAFVTMTIS